MGRKITMLVLLLALITELMGQKDIQREEVATLGAGCFWCVEAIFERLEGVVSVESGYAGGKVANPSYEEVCTGRTGHAEVVQVRFDPQVISFTALLEVVLSTHDPTTLNRQGADVGTQYRSAVFYHNEAQRAEAQRVIRKLEGEQIWNDPIVTTLEPYEIFYRAENYHQEYFELNPDKGYCRVVIRPKVEKFEKAFRSLLIQEE